MKKIIAGVDEVGRGSLIGPVYAAAIILNKQVNKKKFYMGNRISFVKRDRKIQYFKRKFIGYEKSNKKIKKKTTISLS